MAYLLDTGILVRLINAQDARHSEVEQAVDKLIIREEELFVATQNLAELWNVATRPVANNGLALNTATVHQLYQDTIVPATSIVAEREGAHAIFLQLLTRYSVVGKQVHDARLVAIMLVWQIEKLLTLNDRYFRRFEPEGIMIVTPADLAAGGSASP